MKLLKNTIAFLAPAFLILLVGLMLVVCSSCTTVIDVKTLPDGTTITTTTRTSDPAAIAAGIKAVEVLAPVIADLADKQQTTP